MKRNKTMFIFFCLFLQLLTIKAATLKILLWNVENFFDTRDDPLKEDPVLSSREYEAKLQNISRLIKKIKPDLIGLCEIENRFVLNELARCSAYPYFYLIEGNDPRGIDVGMISRYPLHYISHKEQPVPYPGQRDYRFSRDCPLAVLNYEGEKIYILLTHLKAMQDQESEKKRIAQANAILDIISQIYADRKEKQSGVHLLLMGDLNSYRFSEPLAIFQKSGLKILNYRYDQNKLYTTFYRNQKRDLDYMIFNQELLNRVKKYQLRSINEPGLSRISDHFPLLLIMQL